MLRLPFDSKSIQPRLPDHEKLRNSNQLMMSFFITCTRVEFYEVLDGCPQPGTEHRK